jgi:hypothetical protein
MLEIRFPGVIQNEWLIQHPRFETNVVVVCAGGRKVKGPKRILSVFSPFLKKMFSERGGNQDMITVFLPDVNGNVLKTFRDLCTKEL